MDLLQEGDVRELNPTEQSSQDSDRWRVRIGMRLGRKTTSDVREREEAPNPTPKRDKRDRERQRLKHMLTWDSFLPRAMMRIYFERRRYPEHPTAAELLLFINPSSHSLFSPVSSSSCALPSEEETSNCGERRDDDGRDQGGVSAGGGDAPAAVGGPRGQLRAPPHCPLR